MDRQEYYCSIKYIFQTNNTNTTKGWNYAGDTMCACNLFQTFAGLEDIQKKILHNKVVCS